MKRAVLLVVLAAAPAAAQSFADGTPFGGSSVFSNGENPRANPARFDQAPEGFYLGADLGDLKPRGAHNAASEVLIAESDPSSLSAAMADLTTHPWSTRERAYGLAWAWAGGIRFGYTREDLRGTFAMTDAALPQITLDARQAVVDRLYAGAGSQAGRTALGFTVRVERARLGQETLALLPAPGQTPLGDPEAPLDGAGFANTVTSATLDMGLIQEVSQRFRFGITLDRIASRRFDDLKEDSQARAGLQVDLTQSLKLSLESDINAAERLPLPVKRRVDAASLRLEVSPSAFFTLGAERRRYESAPRSTVFGAAFHLRVAPLFLSLGLRFGDDHPLAAAAFRLPGAP
ncbi:MAG TPA: hypothetical protein VFF76_07150 [Holophagaceae bacterium]|jgi:hypothetical protein|nr:hypothetical protein [Holophagaceae bacterium]